MSAVAPRLGGRLRTLGAALSLVIVGALVTTSDLGRLDDALRGRALPLVGLAVGLYLANGLLKALRWWLLLRAAGAAAGFVTAYRAFLVGMALNNLLPGGVAGEAARLGRLGEPVTSSAVAVTAGDRALDGLALAAAAAAGLPLLAGLGSESVPAALAAATFVAVAVAVCAAWRLRPSWARSAVRRPGTCAAAVLLTAAIQANDPLRLVLLAAVYDLDLGFWRAVAIVAAATLSSLLTVFGGGAALAVGIGALLVAAGGSAAAAAAVGLVFVATSTWLSFPLGAAAALAERRPPRPNKEVPWI